MTSDKLRVLVVDDNADYASATVALVGSWGYGVECVQSGSAALTAAESFRPRVVILDLGLPDMHGYELARKIREQAGERKVHFVVITGWMQIADQISSAAAGIAHHLIKPVNLEALQHILAAYQATEELGIPARS